MSTIEGKAPEPYEVSLVGGQLKVLDRQQMTKFQKVQDSVSLFFGRRVEVSSEGRTYSVRKKDFREFMRNNQVYDKDVFTGLNTERVGQVIQAVVDHYFMIQNMPPELRPTPMKEYLLQTRAEILEEQSRAIIKQGRSDSEFRNTWLRYVGKDSALEYKAAYLAVFFGETTRPSPQMTAMGKELVAGLPAEEFEVIKKFLESDPRASSFIIQSRAKR